MSEPRPEAEPVPERLAPEKSEPRSRPGMVGALCLGAAVLTMIGTFQDLLTVVLGAPETQSYVITNWNARVEVAGVSEPELQPVPRNGVPLLGAVAVLLAAAVLGMLAATRPAARVRGLVAVVAAAFLAGTVAVIGMQALWWLEVFQPLDQTEDGTAVGGQDLPTVTVGPGFWTLVAGLALAVVAAVLAWRQCRPEPVRVEPDTPRFGTPVVVRRLPDEAPDEPPGSARGC